MVCSKGPLVSICIAAYNAENYIAQAIRSALAQSYENIEVLVIDDCSSDETYATISSIKDGRLVFHKNKKNLGYLKTFNSLLAMAEGEYVSFLDADDYISNRKIENQLEAFIGAEIGVVACGYSQVDGEGRVVSSHKPPINKQRIYEDFLVKGDLKLSGSSLMIQKSVITEIGGYREYFDRCPGEDIDWLLRIIEKFGYASVPGIDYFYRAHAGSLTRLVHYDLKPRIIHEIIKDLARQRLDNVEDSISSGKIEELQKKYSEPYSLDLGLLYRETMIEHAINGDVMLSIRDCLKALKLSNSKLAVLPPFFVCCIIAIFPFSVLLKLKKAFRITGLSRSFSK